MTTIIINSNELEAVALAASTEETRYYLNGVCIERYEDGTTGLIATDGHRIATLRAKLGEQPKESFILPSADIKRILTLYKGEVKTLAKSVRHFLKIVIGKNEDDKLELSLNLCDDDGISAIRVSFTTKAVDGTFPDWRRVLPAESDEVSPYLAFNADYMADFGKMARLITGIKTPHIVIKQTNPNAPMRVVIAKNDDFLAALMGVRV